MKRVSILAWALAVLLLFTACSTPAAQTPQTSVPPTTTDNRSIEEILLQTYADQYGEELNATSLRYIGCCEGIHLAIFRGAAWQAVTKEIIGGYPFVTPDSNNVRVYMNGKIMFLKDAYEQKLIDDCLLARLYLYYSEKSPVVDMIETIEHAYWDSRSYDFRTHYEETGEAFFCSDMIVEYVGADAGGYMALIDDPLLGYIEGNNADPRFEFKDGNTIVTIGKFKFMYPNEYELHIYKYGELNELVNAYARGWVDDASLEALYNIYIEKYPDRIVQYNEIA